MRVSDLISAVDLIDELESNLEPKTGEYHNQKFAVCMVGIKEGFDNMGDQDAIDRMKLVMDRISTYNLEEGDTEGWKSMFKLMDLVAPFTVGNEYSFVIHDGPCDEGCDHDL